MATRTPRYEVVINSVGIPCATMHEARERANEDATASARIYKRTRNGYDDVTPTTTSHEDAMSQTQNDPFAFDYCDLCDTATPKTHMRPGNICHRCDEDPIRRAFYSNQPLPLELLDTTQEDTMNQTISEVNDPTFGRFLLEMPSYLGHVRRYFWHREQAEAYAAEVTRRGAMTADERDADDELHDALWAIQHPTSTVTPPEEADDFSFANPHDRTKWTAACRGIAAVATLALALLTTIPHGCTFVGYNNTQDEHFPVAHCADGAFLYQDMDGSAHHAPGTWVTLP